MQPKPPRPARRLLKPVTLLLGIKCKDALVMASDSQITDGTSKRVDSTKMEIVHFGEFPVLVAQSGSLLHSNRYVDLLREEAAGVPPSVAEVIRRAQSAMLKLRMEIRETRFGISADDLDLYLMREGLQVGIMLGFFISSTPSIVTISLARAIPNESRFLFETEGCGSTLGNYLLSELVAPNMEMLHAAGVAVYVAEQIKKHDSACGGPTKVSVLKYDTFPVMGSFAQDGIDRCAAEFIKIDAKQKALRAENFMNSMTSGPFRLNETLYIDVL